MHTLYDWLTVLIFSAIAVIFLQRSLKPILRHDPIWIYAPPSIGCAIANHLGNTGQEWIAWLLMIITILYILKVLKPFPLKE